MFYVLFPDIGSALNKQIGKRERVRRSPSTVFFQRRGISDAFIKTEKETYGGINRGEIE